MFAVLPAHYKPVVPLALYTGLRLGELRAQAWCDVNQGTSTLVVTRPKSKQHEVLPLNSVVFAVLAALEQDSPLLLPQLPTKLSDLFIKYARKAGLSDVTFHCLRDPYISRLAIHCATPTLMALVWHRDYRTTRRDVQVDGMHLPEVVKRLTPPQDAGTVTLTVPDDAVSR